MSATLTYPAPAVPTAYLAGEDPLLFRRARTWWTVVALFIIVQAGGLFTVQGHFQYTMKLLRQKTNNPSHDLLPLTLATVAVCIVLMARRIRPAIQLLIQQKALLSVAVLAFISTSWSQVPLLTFRKAALLLFIFAFASFVSTYYTPRDQMRLILAVGVVVAVASAAMAILLPQYGISWGGEWKGIFTQKNHMGIGLVLLFAGLPFCRISSRRELLTLAWQATPVVALILLTRSRTAWFMSVTIIAVRALGPLLTRTRRERIPSLIYTMAFGLAAIALSLGVVLSILGRDLTFTGRTHEWAVIAPFTLNHFWLGYGYQSFWIGDLGDSGTVEHLIGGQNMSDNGYLDAMLQFGLLGMLLLVAVLTACGKDFLRLLRQSSVPLIAYWYVGIILATLVGSFSESILWESGRVDAFLFYLACAGLRGLGSEALNLPGEPLHAA